MYMFVVALILSIFTHLASADLSSYNHSASYDRGFLGLYPSQQYVTFEYDSPRVNIKQWTDQCDDGKYILLTPRGSMVSHPGPMVLDSKGQVVWSGQHFGEVIGLEVQTYKGEDYLTFWKGRDDGTHGYGQYYMVSFARSCLQYLAKFIFSLIHPMISSEQ
jgi:hypothetical protein